MNIFEKIFGKPKLQDIGAVRRSLCVEWNCPWNAWVRDSTADIEVEGGLVDESRVREDMIELVTAIARADRMFPLKGEISRLDQLFKS